MSVLHEQRALVRATVSSGVACRVLLLLVSYRPLGIAAQHAVTAMESRFTLTQGGILDGRQLRRERADRDRERLGRTKRVLHVQVEAVRGPPAKQ